MVLATKGCQTYVEVLLARPSAETFINHRDERGETALYKACSGGKTGTARALLQGGADPTITTNDGITLMAACARFPECVKVLKVRCPHRKSVILLSSDGSRIHWKWAWWQEAERSYLLWNARQVADQQGPAAVAVASDRGAHRRVVVGYAVHRLKGDLFPDLMALMG
jgi:hypothetical protein